MNALGPIVYAFFERHLKGEKGLSPASVKSYRDALRLLLTFIAAQRHRAITRLAIADLTAERVRQFLGSLETERGNHIRTRNQRLAALHTFFGYLARQVPEMLAEAERVAAIPRKRAPPPGTQFLERTQLLRPGPGKNIQISSTLAEQSDKEGWPAARFLPLSKNAPVAFLRARLFGTRYI